MAEKKGSGKKAEVTESHNQEIGRRGEDAAARYLERKGYDILDRNFVCPFGEADIIARNEAAIVFVEVKTRTGEHCGLPEDAITAEKRRRYENIAIAYLRDHEAPSDMSVRFDVVAIFVVAPDRAIVRHHLNAWGSM